MISRKFHHHRRGLLPALLLLGSALSPLLAQDVQQQQTAPVDSPPVGTENPEPIGPPQLRRYELPGERIEPAQSPAPEVTPEPARRPVDTRSPATEPISSSRSPPASQSAAGVAEGTGPGGQSGIPNDTSTDLPADASAPVSTESTSMIPGDVIGGSSLPFATNENADTRSPANGGVRLYWPYVLAAAVGIALVLLGLKLFGRRRAEDERIEYPIVGAGALEAGASSATALSDPERADAPSGAVKVDADPPSFLFRPVTPYPQRPEVEEMQPLPVPTSSAADVPDHIGKPADDRDAGLIGIQMRPWLQLEFRPDRAAATVTEAVVQYELVITNTGNSIARNVRVDARMFNASAQQEEEIRRFFNAPASEAGDAAVLAIPPRQAVSLRNAVTLPKEHVREIEINGRKLFIPMVAFNVFYEWSDGKRGQTSLSYLVGREPAQPSRKMGAFRLDLGPRIYRQVAQRPSEPTVVV